MKATLTTTIGNGILFKKYWLGSVEETLFEDKIEMLAKKIVVPYFTANVKSENVQLEYDIRQRDEREYVKRKQL